MSRPTTTHRPRGCSAPQGRRVDPTPPAVDGPRRSSELGVHGLSVAQLQQVLRDAQHSTPLPAPGHGLSSLSDYRPPPVPAAGGTAARTVVVVGAHPGAGASTVAVLLADAAAATGQRVRLVDDGDQALSGLSGVCDAELGDDAGWCHGRRGDRIEVYRRASPAAVVDPARSGIDGRGCPDGHLLIIDAGWSAPDPTGKPRPAVIGSGAVTVLVCRPTVPSMRRAEQVATAVDALVVVAAIGPSRWPRVVTASTGPLLADARHDDRLVAVPLDQRLTTTGPTAQPLPRTLMVAGRALLVRLDQLPNPRGTPTSGEAPASRRALTSGRARTSHQPASPRPQEPTDVR
jgi:hypothetical protein